MVSVPKQESVHDKCMTTTGILPTAYPVGQCVVSGKGWGYPVLVLARGMGHRVPCPGQGKGYPVLVIPGEGVGRE